MIDRVVSSFDDNHRSIIQIANSLRSTFTGFDDLDFQGFARQDALYACEHGLAPTGELQLEQLMKRVGIFFVIVRLVQGIEAQRSPPLAADLALRVACG